MFVCVCFVLSRVFYGVFFCVVHLCSNAADLVANVVAVELATGALNFVSVLKLLLFTLEFVD